MAKKQDATAVAIVDDSNYAGSNLPVTQADFDALSQQRKMLKEFVKNQLVEKVDYGIIPGTPKPSLYKPGAEKLKMLFGLGARNILASKELDRKENYLSYEYRAEAYHLKTGRVIADCTGVCNSQEKKYRERAVYVGKGNSRKFSYMEVVPVSEIQNTISKMAQKRAFVGAIILATGASDFFTHDLEDYDESPGHPIETNNIKAEEKKSKFEDDERTKKLNWLISACRQVGISRADILKKYKVDELVDLTDAQRTDLDAIGRAIHAGTKSIEDEFPS